MIINCTIILYITIKMLCNLSIRNLTNNNCRLQFRILFEKGAWGGRIIVFNATFNNISVISSRLALLVDANGDNHRPVVSHWQNWSHNVVSSTPPHTGFELTIEYYWQHDCVSWLLLKKWAIFFIIFIHIVSGPSLSWCLVVRYPN